jgi:uncharacterized protein YgbK (DUF1537 family)
MNATPQIAIIADDLTGAADTGACFAGLGLVTSVALAPDSLPTCDVLVLSTESRHLTREQAVAHVQSATARVGNATWVYKKIDSTLRGHIAAELAATMDVLNEDRALVAPAFPAEGRTTVLGCQRIAGIPIEQTSFGKEVSCSDLYTTLSRGLPNKVVQLIPLEVVRRSHPSLEETLELRRPGVFIADAETDVDLTKIARAAMNARVRLLCGSAGLARAIARIIAFVPDVHPAPIPICCDGPIMVVAGSRHEITIRQVEFAQKHGAVVLVPEPSFLDDNNEVAKAALIDRATQTLADGRDLILTTIGLPECQLGSQFVADQLARAVGIVVKTTRLGGLVLTGGDLATAVCNALGANVLWLHGEVQPGIAWGTLTGNEFSALPIVTKAGGFGADPALWSATTFLRGLH